MEMVDFVRRFIKNLINEIKWRKLKWELRNIEPYDCKKELSE